METGKSMDHAGEAAVNAVPEDYEGLRALLLSRRDSLPKRLKQLAAFALEHPEEVAFGTVAGIAEHAGVQPSTLVRFAKSLGYDGFSHLQQIFRDRLRERFPDYRERLRVLRGSEGHHVHAASLLEGFTNAAVISLEKMRDTVRPEELSRAIETLAKAETIYLLGARRVFPIAAYCAYAFGKLGVRAILIDHVAQLGPEQLATATERDAVLAISFTPYAPVTADLAAIAARRNIPVVAITDSAFSPLVGSADVWLEIAEADFSAFRSLSASFALAMALAVGTAEKRAEGAEADE
jgi:DNA-binding MurR/RpiR family transcriptional regulator